ncbi:hypothetical protein CTA2_9973 [Colletotrichum tanaceti]|uniref:Magnesium transport protein CorA n=1 Tax=Colletotrichum tanaceti TaxID=1306861 RepID=A0A4V6DGX7_9PEZI|nr:hypothetical protein CTA2_9973 [Colletotrichum tanaceti]TKW53766.1 hypothetical protein CTA1_3337 [Colletotrichum tanaceti]
MDLPVQNKGWTASDLDFFEYGEGTAVVLRTLEGEECTKEILCTKEDWEKWFDSTSTMSPDSAPLQSELNVILCNRGLPIFGGNSGPVQDLPFTRNTWERLVRYFHVPLNVKRTISRRVPCFSSTREYDSVSGQVKMSSTARMSASLPDDLAMSTTYIPDTNSTFAVVYGCNDKQMGDIERRIRRADGQLRHPMLIPGIFAEVERTRLVGTVETLMDVFALRSERLNSTSKAEPWSPETDADGKRTQEHLNLCMESRDLISHISAVKRQLAKLLKEMSAVEREIGSLRDRVDSSMPREHERVREPGLLDTGARMRSRVEDILIEYDDKIDDCNMMICNMSLAMQTVWNHIARQDSETNTKISQANAAIAVQTKVESAQMRTIALLTMIYLPVASVASIFSMDMFNWEAVDGQMIVSKHIWLFFVLAVGLTLITVAAWFFGTRREKAMASKSDEYFNSPQRKNTLEYV